MMLSHSYQVTSKKRMSLHQKSRKMLKYVSTGFCGRTAGRLTISSVAPQPCQAPEVGSSPQRRAQVDRLSFPVRYYLFGCCIATIAHAGNDSGDWGPLGPQKRRFPSIQQKLPSDSIPSSRSFGAPVRQNPLSPHLVADPCRDSGGHSADPARFADVSVCAKQNEHSRCHAPEDHAESVPTRRTSRSQCVRVILHLLSLVLDERPTKGGESPQNEATALVEIVRRILFDAGQSGSAARRGRVACCWRNCSRMAEHGMLRRKDGEDDRREAGDEELRQNEKDVVASDGASSVSCSYSWWRLKGRVLTRG